MIIINLALFLFSFFVLINCAEYSIKYSSRIAKILRFPEFIVSFFIITFISVLPEGTISIISAFNGEPGLGLGTLLGSNVADLTIVFGIATLFSSRGIKVKSKILRNNLFYLFLLLFPLILGFDGKFSRVDGLILFFVGAIFFVKVYNESNRFRKKFNDSPKGSFFRSFMLLLLSFGILILSAFFTVKFAVNFAHDIKLPSMLIGITVLALGTCLPELIFSIKAVKRNHDDLALGDLMGTVITDATILLGIVALISPFNYTPSSVYVLGGAMFLAGIFVTTFMKSDKLLTKTEALILILFYILFVFVEFFAVRLI